MFEHQVVQHPGAAVIIPVLDENHLICIRQFRSSIRRVLWEFPAGTLEKGESPLACARRELAEEVHCQARYFKKIGTIYPAPGISTELMHLYVAWSLTPALKDRDHDEFLEPKVLSLSDFDRMIARGVIQDAKTVVGYFYGKKFLSSFFRKRLSKQTRNRSSNAEVKKRLRKGRCHG